MGSESNRSGGGAGAGASGGGGGGLQLSPEVKKVMQQIREVVQKNCTDAEIYSVLRDCNMDANDAVQKLLSQDTFHEVKSKRERRKETKETHESKGRGNNNGFHGVKVGGEYSVGRAVPSQLSYNDPGKAAYKKENASIASSAPASSPSSTTTTRYMKKINEQPQPYSDSFSGHNSWQIAATGDTISPTAQASALSQSTWLGGAPGHVTMADVVKMGKQQHKVSQNALETSSTPQDADSQNLSQYHFKAPRDYLHHQEIDPDLQCSYPSHVSKANDASLIVYRKHDFIDEWPLVDQQMSATRPSILKSSTVIGSEISSNQLYFNGDVANLSSDCLPERGAATKNPGSSSAESSSPSIETQSGNGAGGASDWAGVIGSNSHLSFANGAASLLEEVSSASVNLQQLNLGKESITSPSHDKRGVVFPSDMQALAADCSHLSFGTYKSAAHATNSRPLASKEASAVTYGTSAASLDTRSSGYLERFHDEQLGSKANVHCLSADIYNSDVPLYSHSQPDLTRQKVPEVSDNQDYVHPLSVPDSNFKKTQELSSSLSVVINPNARNLPPLHRELQAMPMPIPIDLLASSVQSLRDSDHIRSSFVGSSIPSRYTGAMSTISGPSNPVSEIQKSSAFSLLSTAYSPVSSGSSFATGPPVPQHLQAHLYSQPALSLEELTHFNNYPGMTQNYAQNPSAMQQRVYQDNNAFHDSFVGMNYSLPQFKSPAQTSNFTLSDSYTSGYGSYGNPTNFPRGFMQDLSTNPAGSAVGYDALASQHQERNNFTMFQQNGTSSRTFSSVPDSRYYTLPGQSPLPSRYHQQTQQHTQDYSALLRGNTYHSQSELAEEQPHQQSLIDAAFNSSQGPSTKLHQLWQHNY